MTKLQKLFFVLGFAFCIVPPSVATFQFFPVWRENPSKSVSGMAAILICLSLIPLWKYVKKAMKSPSAWQVWLVVTVFCLVIKNIVSDMFVIAVVGLISSAIGTVFFCLSKDKKKEVKEDGRD